MAQVVDLQFTKGGPIIAVQVIASVAYIPETKTYCVYGFKTH